MNSNKNYYLKYIKYKKKYLCLKNKLNIQKGGNYEYDQEGFDQEGFGQEGFGQEGFEQEMYGQQYDPRPINYDDPSLFEEAIGWINIQINNINTQLYQKNYQLENLNKKLQIEKTQLNNNLTQLKIEEKLLTKLIIKFNENFNDNTQFKNIYNDMKKNIYLNTNSISQYNFDKNYVNTINQQNKLFNHDTNIFKNKINQTEQFVKIDLKAITDKKIIIENLKNLIKKLQDEISLIEKEKEFLLKEINDLNTKLNQFNSEKSRIYLTRELMMEDDGDDYDDDYGDYGDYDDYGQYGDNEYPDEY